MRILVLILLFLIPSIANAAIKTVKQAGGGDYTTIQACATAASAGTTCVVYAGTYNERVTVNVSGSSGSPITFQAETDCVSNNGATVGSSCIKVRGFTINSTKNYITIQGFELTNQGMSADTTQSILNNGTNVRVINNYIHDTTAPCIRYNAGSDNLYVGGNNISYCGESMAVSGISASTVTITTGVNDTLKLTVQGVDKTVTLTAGSRTLAQINAEIVAQAAGTSVVVGATGMTIYSSTLGPTSSLVVASVANDAYTTLGLSVGSGSLIGTSIAITAGGSGGSDNFLIENNVISYVSDYFIPSGTNDSEAVYRSNVMGPTTLSQHFHVDGWQPGPSTNILVEDNVSVDNYNSDNHFLLNQTTATHFIVRYNKTCRTPGGLEFVDPGLYFYNNTFYDNYAYAVLGGGAGGAQLNVHAAGATAYTRNNIWYKSINPDNAHGFIYQTSAGGTIDHDYSLWYGFVNPGDTHYVNADPLVVDATSCDFTLQSTSPAIDTGGPLTTVAVADTGTGTSLVLTDADYFQPGWAGTNPDWIAVGNVSNTVQISSIDYTTDTVTLANSITRNDGDSVWLYKKSDGDVVLYGTAPDLGAAEYPTPVTTVDLLIQGNALISGTTSF